MGGPHPGELPPKSWTSDLQPNNIYDREGATNLLQAVLVLEGEW